MGGAIDRFDEQPLVAFPVDGVQVAAVQLEVGQPQMGKVADQAEAAAEMLQAETAAQFAQDLAEALQFGRGWRPVPGSAGAPPADAP